VKSRINVNKIVEIDDVRRTVVTWLKQTSLARIADHSNFSTTALGDLRRELKIPAYKPLRKVTKGTKFHMRKNTKLLQKLMGNWKTCE